MTWDAEIVGERFSAAATTLARSRALGVGPVGFKVAWPDVVMDRREAYGYTAAAAVRIQPSAAELTALDQVLQWVPRYLSGRASTMAGLPEDAGWIVWMRAGGTSFAGIAKVRGGRWRTKPSGGNSGEAIRTIERRAREHVATALNRDRVPIHVGAAEAAADPPPVLQGRGEAMPRQMDTRRFVANLRPCGECRFMVTVQQMTKCGLRGGAVAPMMRAQHPENEPCFERKPEAA